MFFLHGVRLPREALVAGVTDWRLQGTILLITFGLFPLIGLGLWWLAPNLLPAPLWAGLLFLCALPSTVQSSIAFISLARGNVAGAVAAAAFSNLAGVFLSPLLIALMLDAKGAAITLAGVGKIFALLFLPFVLGHAARPWLMTFVQHQPRLTTTVDKGTILLAVYGAFSAATLQGVWHATPPAALLTLSVLCLLLLAVVLAAGWALGSRFPRESRIAILFCGSVKSLASGAPMARILFPGAAAAPVLLPVMLFHTLQLILCAWIAAHLARRP